MSEHTNLGKDIQAAINRNSAENISNTPDFILAQFLQSCLSAFDVAVQQRETWYGRDAAPTGFGAPRPAGALIPEPQDDPK